MEPCTQQTVYHLLLYRYSATVSDVLQYFSQSVTKAQLYKPVLSKNIVKGWIKQGGVSNTLTTVWAYEDKGALMEKSNHPLLFFFKPHYHMLEHFFSTTQTPPLRSPTTERPLCSKGDRVLPYLPFPQLLFCFVFLLFKNFFFVLFSVFVFLLMAWSFKDFLKYWFLLH